MELDMRDNLTCELAVFAVKATVGHLHRVADVV